MTAVPVPKSKTRDQVLIAAGVDPNRDCEVVETADDARGQAHVVGDTVQLDGIAEHRNPWAGRPTTAVQVVDLDHVGFSFAARGEENDPQ